MSLEKVLHMNGGEGGESYANNSLLQRKAISSTKHLRDEVITNMCCNTLPISLAIADMGCSYGPNALLVISETIKVVEKHYEEMNHKSPEYKVFLNDLPGNDFNNIFQSLDTFKENLRLTFLSKVPEGVENNKGNIYLSTTSPSNVLEAYYKQYKIDFSHFLKCRAQELVEGGRLFVTFIGRQSEDPSSKECCYIWELMSMALNDMVLQGIIKEEKLNTFNLPVYYPSSSEVKLEVLTEGTFTINQLEASEVNLSELDDGYNLAQCIRAVAEPLLISHFGRDITKEVFNRFQKNVTDHMPKEETKVTNITLVLTRNP
ncbi:S-adenosyl-L-methionine:benzoic acid/salicylic acid carboxyl methyltransferase [Trifolium repens]|nr:S-adenosyl-L-methionine:benzoic acid/salicylic acid carboxyl methyltransferase [Trifolium repens]